MNLKESFRYQTFLSAMMDIGVRYLQNSSNTKDTVQEHQKSKVNSTDADERIEVNYHIGRTKYDVDTVIEIILNLIAEKEKLCSAISYAKANCEIDIDGAIETNKSRQEVSKVLASISTIKASEQIGKATAYKFNVEGNQVPYTYEVKETSTPNFNTGNAKAESKNLITIADDVSASLDKVMIESDIDYDAKYNVNDSFEDIYQQFTQGTTE